MDRTVLDRIAGLVDDLPALPSVAQQVLALLSTPTTEPEELQGVLSRDAALALKVLRLANSAYYCRGRVVSTLNGAIVLLGFKTLQTLVLGSAVQRVLGAAGAAAETLWLHSFGAAVACRELARCARPRPWDPEEAFLAGLFHDVAKGVIAAKFPGVYARPLDAAGEEEALGFHHGHLGQVLLTRWEIPPGLVAAVGAHHDPGAGGLAALARLGDALAWEPAPGVGSAPAPCDEALSALGIGPGQRDGLRAAVAGCLAEERGSA